MYINEVFPKIKVSYLRIVLFCFYILKVYFCLCSFKRDERAWLFGIFVHTILVVVIRLLFNNFLPRYYSFRDSTRGKYRIISKESIFKGKHLFREWMETVLFKSQYFAMVAYLNFYTVTRNLFLYLR